MAGRFTEPDAPPLMIMKGGNRLNPAVLQRASQLGLPDREGPGAAPFRQQHFLLVRQQAIFALSCAADQAGTDAISGAEAKTVASKSDNNGRKTAKWPKTPRIPVMISDGNTYRRQTAAGSGARHRSGG